MRLFLICLLSLLCAKPAFAADYPAGTIGYVYERCQADLKNSRSEKIFQKTYCGQFFAGFFPAVVASNWIILQQIHEDEPCKEEMEKAHAFVSGKPKTEEESKKSKPPEFFGIVNFFENIQSKFEQQGRKEEIFAQPVVMSWKYFSNIERDLFNKLHDNPKFDIHPDLAKDMEDMKMYTKNPEGFWGGTFSIQDTYDLCLAGITDARGSEERFSETVCGAGILGVLSGMLTIKRMELRPPVVGECKETIDKFFDQFDIEKKTCFSEKIRAIDVASVFIRAADKGFPNNSGEGNERAEAIDWTLTASPMSVYGFANQYKTACEWHDLPHYDFNKFKTYNE